MAVAGIPGIKFTLDLEDVQRMYKWFAQLDVIARNPDAMANPMIAVGKVIYANFIAEGAKTGKKWQRLSPYTQKVRKERGYTGAGPVLEQSGELRKMIYALQQWGHRASVHVDDSATPYENDGTTHLTASLGSLSAQATISGPKASHNRENRSGTFARGLALSSLESTRGGSGYIPARPYFYISPLAAEVAAAEFGSRILLDWRARDILNTDITGMNIPKVIL